jgi:hypothetical protein
MHVDEAGHQEKALADEIGANDGGLADLGDPVALDPERAARDHAVGQDDAKVTQPHETSPGLRSGVDAAPIFAAERGGAGGAIGSAAALTAK